MLPGRRGGRPTISVTTSAPMGSSGPGGRTAASSGVCPPGAARRKAVACCSRLAKGSSPSWLQRGTRATKPFPDSRTWSCATPRRGIGSSAPEGKPAKVGSRVRAP
ncbi:hypothetical protein [Azospirillum sp. Marseille-Q6669]